MAAPPRLKWTQIDAELRGELEAILRAVRAKRDPERSLFHNDSDEFMPFVLLAIIAAGVGLIACSYFLIVDDGLSDLGDLLGSLLSAPISTVRALISSHPYAAGLVGSLLALILLGWIWLRHHGRRGLAITRYALVILRGPRVRVIPYCDMASTTLSSHGRRGSRFTVLRIQWRDGRSTDLIATRNWANLAVARIAEVNDADARQADAAG